MLNGNVSPNFTYVDNPLNFEKDMHKKMILTMNVHWEYIRLIIYPNTLSCDYGPVSLPTSNNEVCSNNQIVASFVSLVATNNYTDTNGTFVSCIIVQASILYGFLMTMFFISMYYYMYQRNGIKLFAFLWFLVSIYPASHLGMKIGTVVAERLLYTPIVAVLLWFFSSFVDVNDVGAKDSEIVDKENKISTNNQITNINKTVSNFVCSICSVLYRVILSIIIIKLAMQSMNRVDKWKDNITLFKSALETYPNNARMNNNVGTIILRNSVNSVKRTKDLQLAQTHFHRAVTSAPTHAMAWHNYGLTLLMLNRPKDSLPYFENAIKLEANVEMILNNYGIALKNAGKTQKAQQIFKRAENVGKLLQQNKQVKRPGFDE